MGKQHVIFIPGLGDHKSKTLTRIIESYRGTNIEPHFHQMNWIDKEPFTPKLNRLLDQVNQLSSGGDSVSLVGISAGASVAINAYINLPAKKVDRVVLICGKMRGSQNVNPVFYQKNPAFKESLLACEQNLAKLSPKDTQKMLCLRPFLDNYVPPGDSVINGTKIKVLPLMGHVLTIFLALTFYRRIIINFVEN